MDPDFEAQRARLIEELGPENVPHPWREGVEQRVGNVVWRSPSEAQLHALARDLLYLKMRAERRRRSSGA